MNTKKTVVIVLGVIVVLLALCAAQYNSLVRSQETVKTEQANIGTALQRRADLIPNLVKTVKSFATHETDVIDKVLEAREALIGASTVKEQDEADKVLSQSLSDLTVVVENYPELKSDSTYVSLMDELAGSENRISVARRDYNTEVQDYNHRVISFPANIMASLFGFEKAEYFEADSTSETTPDVGNLLGE